MTSTARVDVLGVGISAVDMETTLEVISSWIETGARHYVCVTGVHGVMESVRDPKLQAIHNRSGLTIPDGMPMVWCSHWAGARQVRRVSGADLMLRVAELAGKRGWTSFFYGGGDQVADILARRLESTHPGFRTVGTYTPPFRELTEAEDRAVVDMINVAKPDLLWVGLSTPKQERWMASHTGRLQVPAILGVGAAFDIHADLIPRAPPWMQSSGMEWMFRLGKEPGRLWRRYFRNNPSFVVRVLIRPPTLLEPDTTRDA